MTVGILHTTESDSFDSTDAWFRQKPGIQPHVMIDPASGRVRTYIDYDKPAKALANLPGGVETNRRGGVIQVEIVGRAAQMPNMTGEWYRRLAQMLGAIGSDAGVPPVFPCPFVAYPASYGLKAAQRLTSARWAGVAGWIGHQHVPENTHGDPGDLNRLIPLMTGATTLPTPTTPLPENHPGARIQRAINANGLQPPLKVDGDPGELTADGLDKVLAYLAATIGDLRKANATSADTIKRLSQDVTKLRAEAEIGQHAYDEAKVQLAERNAQLDQAVLDLARADEQAGHLRSTIVADVVADIRAAVAKLGGGA